MIRAINDPFSIDVTYEWEETDKLIAKSLSFETEQHYLALAREIRESIMLVPMDLTPEEEARAAREKIFLRGKYELLLDLVAASKEAKESQHLI